MIYAAYGSNMNIQQMRGRCPAAQLLSTGWLNNYMLTFRGSRRGVANIEPKTGMQVPVVLWDITKGCEAVLDVYEGYPRLYEKQKITVVTALGETITAMAYIMCAQYNSMPAAPESRYYQIIQQGYKDNKLDIKPLEEALVGLYDELRERKSSF